MKYFEALTCFLLFTTCVQGAIFCPLKWETTGYGNASSSQPPYTSVLVDPELDNQVGAEYIGRVFHQSQWLFGRIQHYNDGQIHIGHDNQEFNYSMYQILTNPNKCQLTWKHSGYGAAVSFAVSLESEGESTLWTISADYQAVSRGNVYYAGRTEIEEKNLTRKLAGNINPAQFAISVGYAGEQKLENQYEILTSTYPELVVEMSEFKFEISQADFAAMEETITQVELIGQDDIHIRPKSKGIRFNLNQKINHFKQFQEIIYLEDELKWSEVNLIKDLHLSLWFGGSDVTGTDIPTAVGRRVKVGRVKDVSIERDLSIQAESETQKSQIQVCSLALILENPKIPFTATGTFYEGSSLRGITLSAEQIVHILETSGRENIRVEGDRVTAQVKGVLSGRFFLRSLSFVSDLVDATQGKQSCLSLYPNWLETL